MMPYFSKKVNFPLIVGSSAYDWSEAPLTPRLTKTHFHDFLDAYPLANSFLAGGFMRYEQFVTGEYYHVYNRGVDRRTTFHSESDLERFLESLRVFNTDLAIGENISFLRRCQREYPPEQRLASISSFALLPNHFHLLAQQQQEHGLPQFMHRVGTSFTKYVNLKEKRSGYLFEGPFQAKRVDNYPYLAHLLRYHHINPLSLIGINWKTEGIVDVDTAVRFLKSYRWSSFYYYYNHIESPMLDLTLLNHLFASPEEHLEFMLDYQPTQSPDGIDFL
jgi:REP element-mobilizing transposase RayT